MLTLIGKNKANLTLSYNTLYNVSVVAEVCGRLDASTIFMVNYSKYTSMFMDSMKAIFP